MRLLRGAVLALSLSLARPSAAFPYTVQQGETLAQLATRFYGSVQYERVLSAANGLDRTKTSSLTPGMVLEVPATTYHRVQAGETWESLSRGYLGSESRAISLATANDSKPWIQPETGLIIRIPYNLALILHGDESLESLAYRYLGNSKFAWELMQYNGIEKPSFREGQILLIPLRTLELTSEGRTFAERAAASIRERTDGGVRDLQRDSHNQLTELTAHVRRGHYVAALRQASFLRARGGMTAADQIRLLSLEIEILVAFDALGPAKMACSELRKEDPKHFFDPIMTSPKILQACPNPVHPTPGSPAP